MPRADVAEAAWSLIAYVRSNDWVDPYWRGKRPIACGPVAFYAV